MLHHNEPLLRDGEIVGFVTSGAFAYVQGASIGLCFVSLPEGATGKASLEQGQYEVVVEGRNLPVELSAKALSAPCTSG